MNPKKELNPFVPQLKVVSARLESAQQELDILAEQLAWYQSTSNDALGARLDREKVGEAQMQEARDGLLARKKREEELRASISQDVGSLLNPKNWFSKDQQRLRIQLKEKDGQIERLIKILASRQAELKQQKSVTVALQSDIERFRAFDVESTQGAMDEKRHQLLKLKAEYTVLEERRAQVDDALSPLIKELEDLVTRKKQLAEQLGVIDSYQARLSFASNSYERKMVHQDCEKKFGTGNPQRAKARIERELSGINRSIEKLDSRAEKLAEIHSREVRKLVIDGNNLCYENGNQFVGLAPLVALTKALLDRFEVLVIFDAAIRSMVRASDAEIRSALPKGVNVHVVATRQTADETLLEAASELGDVYVLSNDRFSDFPEKEVVRSQRLIRHEIIEGKVMVTDLGLVESYR